MLTLFIGLYLALANYFKGVLKIHSIIHCVSATLFGTYLFYISNISIFSISFCSEVIKTENFNNFLYVNNSLGYFIADSIDIFLDWKNVKRRVFLLHHVSAIIGILTGGSSLVAYAIWALEIGGVVHHLKHASEVYNFNSNIKSLIFSIYFIVYSFTRILLFLNCNSCLINNSLTGYQLIGVFMSYILILQNAIWLMQNLLKLSN